MGGWNRLSAKEKAIFMEEFHKLSGHFKKDQFIHPAVENFLKNPKRFLDILIGDVSRLNSDLFITSQGSMKGISEAELARRLNKFEESEVEESYQP